MLCADNELIDALHERLCVIREEQPHKVVTCGLQAAVVAPETSAAAVQLYQPLYCWSTVFYSCDNSSLDEEAHCSMGESRLRQGPLVPMIQVNLCTKEGAPQQFLQFKTGLPTACWKQFQAYIQDALLPDLSCKL